MVTLDDIRDLLIYKKPFFLPMDGINKKNNSLITLLTPNIDSSISCMNIPYVINRRYFESYYMNRDINTYITESFEDMFDINYVYLREGNYYNSKAMLKKPGAANYNGDVGDVDDVNYLKSMITIDKLRDIYNKCNINISYLSPKIPIDISIVKNVDDQNITDKNISIVGNKYWDNIDVDYNKYIDLILTMFAYLSVNNKCIDLVLYSLSCYINNLKFSNKDWNKFYNYIVKKYGKNHLLYIVKKSSDQRYIMKLITEFYMDKYRLNDINRDYIYSKFNIDDFNTGILSEKTSDLSEKENRSLNSGNNISKKIIYRVKTKLNKPIKELKKSTNAENLNIDNKYSDSDNKEESVEEFTVLESSKYDYKYKLELYKNRLKTPKDLLNIYNYIKSKCFSIRYTFLNIDKYKNKNMFFDLSFYNELFFKYIGNTSGINKLKMMDMYKVILERFINSGKLLNYKKNTMFIPIMDWRGNSSMMWMYKESINPISVFFYCLKYNPSDIINIFGYNVDIIFLGKYNYFKFNTSLVNSDDNRTILNKFIFNIKRLVDLGLSNKTDDDPDEDDRSSSKAIALDIIDKIEKTQNVDIDNIEYIIGNNDEDKEDLAKLLKISNDLDIINVDYDDKKDINIKSIQNYSKDKNNKPDNTIVKEKIVKKIIDISKTSKDVDDAIHKLEVDKEFDQMLDDIKNEEENNIKISNSRASRILQLSEEMNKLSIKNKSVKDLLEEDPNSIELPKTKLNIASIDKSWDDMKFMNFDKNYDPDSDIVKMLNSMSKWSYPIAVRNIDVKDNSTSEDYIDLWSIECEDYKGTRFTLKLDIPKFINDKFLKLRGNEKVLMIQSSMIPIMKSDEDTCQIIGVGGYNKIFIYRYGSRSGQSVSIVSRFIKSLNKYISNNKNSDIKVVYGDNINSSRKYELPIDYIDLGSVFSIIETDLFKFFLNQDDLRSNFKVDDTKGLPIGINKKTLNVIYYNDEVSTSNKFVVSYIIDLVLNSSSDEFLEIFRNANKPSKSTYSRVKMVNTFIPLVIVCAYSEGLIKVLEKGGIKYSFVKNLDKKDRLSNTHDFIKFNDGYLLYELSYSSSLLLNGLKEIDTTQYSIRDINKKTMYSNYISSLGNVLVIDGLDNSYDCMIDPITKDVLQTYKLPTDYISVLLYSNMLLADNKYINHTDMTARRFRRKELIAGYFYKALTSAYQTYANELRHNRKNVKMTVKQSEVIDTLLSKDPSTNDLSINNVINDIECANTVTSKGLIGMNIDRAYSLDKRGYDETMLNVLGMSTGFSGTVGINRQATIDANISSARGYVVVSDPQNKKDTIGTTKSLTITEALTPFGSTHDDTFRTLMTHIQTSKHTIRTVHSDPLLVTNGSDEAVPYMASDIFAFKAKEDGIVKEVTDKYMVVEYNSGNCEFIDLEEDIKKNSDGGYYVPMKLSTKYKEGTKFKSNSILAYDKSSFSNSLGESDNLAVNIGTLAKVAVLNIDEGFEDSAACTESFAKKMATEVIVKKEVVFRKDDNIELLKNINDSIVEGDTLISYQSSLDDDLSDSLLKNLNVSGDELSELGRNPIKSKYTGTLVGINVYYTSEFSELSPSLKKLVKMYSKKINEKKDIYQKYNINTNTLPITTKSSNTGKTKNIEDGVLVEFYIKYFDIPGVGDKCVFYSANKGVFKYIIPEGQEPTSSFRPEEPIDAFVSIGSINGRMVCSTQLYGSIAKLMVELDRSCKDLAGIKYDSTKI